MSRPFSLLGLPDDLLSVIVINAGHDPIRQLLFVSRRFHRICQPAFRAHALFGSTAVSRLSSSVATNLIHDVVDHARSNPNLIRLVLQTHTVEGVIGILDQLLREGNYAEMIQDLLDVFPIEMFRDIGPGIALHYTIGKRVFPHDFRQIFHLADSAAPIRAEIGEKFDRLIEEFLFKSRFRGGPHWVPPLDSSVFSEDVIHLHGVYGWRLRLHEFLACNWSSYNGVPVLKQPAILHALARIGIRFPFWSFLENIYPISLREFQRLAPFLSPHPNEFLYPGCSNDVCVVDEISAKVLRLFPEICKFHHFREQPFVKEILRLFALILEHDPAPIPHELLTFPTLSCRFVNMVTRNTKRIGICQIKDIVRKYNYGDRDPPR